MPGGKVLIGGGGCGTLLIILVAICLGADPLKLLQQLPVDTTPPPGAKRSDDELKKFVEVVLKDTEDVWDKQFQVHQRGKTYRHPKLVLYTDRTRSGCGLADSRIGPFYCPEDEKVYLDLSFAKDLDRMGGKGDFALAYVVAHEVGHHVQHLLGTTDMVHAKKRSLSEKEYNQLSVRLELQADFYAGVWARHVQKYLEPGDIEEAMAAAQAVGDDRIQRESLGRVVPDKFTHGTSAQRVRWFKRGFETGDMTKGDTFNARDL